MCDHIIDELVHCRDIGVELCGRFLGKFLLDWQTRDDVERFPQRTTETEQEGIELAAFKTLEAMSKSRDRNAVERQPCHVVGNKDILASMSGPLGNELVAHFEDEVVIAAHRPLAERGQQDPMGLAPIRLVAERCKQTVACEFPNDTQSGSGDFAEPRFVAQFGN